MDLTFNRTVTLVGRPVTLSLAAEILRPSQTSHRTTQVSVGLDDLEAGGSAAANAALWPAAEAWCLAHEAELEREALERGGLINQWA